MAMDYIWIIYGYGLLWIIYGLYMAMDQYLLIPCLVG